MKLIISDCTKNDLLMIEDRARRLGGWVNLTTREVRLNFISELAIEGLTASQLFATEVNNGTAGI